MLLALGLVSGAVNPATSAQSTSSGIPSGATIHGKVFSSTGKLASGANIHLLQGGVSRAEAVADAQGEYSISGLKTGSYVLVAEKAGVRGPIAELTISSLQEAPEVDLKLAGSSTGAGASEARLAGPSGAIEFADNPNFAV